MSALQLAVKEREMLKPASDRTVSTSIARAEPNDSQVDALKEGTAASKAALMIPSVMHCNEQLVTWGS